MSRNKESKELKRRHTMNKPGRAHSAAEPPTAVLLIAFVLGIIQLQPRGLPVQYSPRSRHGVPGNEKGRPDADFIQQRPKTWDAAAGSAAAPEAPPRLRGRHGEAPAGQRPIPHGLGGGMGRPGRASPSPGPRGAGDRPLASGCSCGRQRRDEAVEDRGEAAAAPQTRSYLLRLFSQGDAHGSETRL